MFEAFECFMLKTNDLFLSQKMDGTGEFSERADESTIITRQSHDASDLCQVSRCWPVQDGGHLLGSGSIPLSLTTCPMNFVFIWNSLHFARFNFNSALSRRSITNLSLSRCRSNVSAITMTSCRYTRQTSQVSPARTRSIILWSSGGARSNRS